MSLGLLLLLLVPVSEAGNCGSDECGDHGICRAQSLIASCECDVGYVSVTTYIGGGSQGAWCTPMPAAPDDPMCVDIDCGEHGVCVVVGDTGQCACDPGFREGPMGGCEDDPSDPSEARCEGVLCGEDTPCMATPDGATCRCLGGEYVVVGLDANRSLGPVCQAAADPASACGPEQCGPRGQCVISQAVFCRCDEGFEVIDVVGSDGRTHPYCNHPDDPPPMIEPRADSDGGVMEPVDAGTPDTRGGGAPVLADVSTNDGVPPEVRPPQEGWGCRTLAWLRSVQMATGICHLRR